MISTYERWMEDERIPIVEGDGTDLRAVQVEPWPRLNALGSFVDLRGLEGLTGMYVCEIPPGGAVLPEKHCFDEVIYVLSGRGTAKVWNGAEESDPHGSAVFEWQEGSLFAPPINTWHQFFNTSGVEPARFVAVTTAPLVLDVFHSVPFVFGNTHVFDDRFDGKATYFDTVRPAYQTRPNRSRLVWETNFVADLRAEIEVQGSQRHGSAGTVAHELSGNSLTGHIAEWAPGRYGRAHHHMGGAVLVIVRGEGYTLMWPLEAGTRPYESGNADQVVRVDWREGSAFSPPTAWFHQHFVTSCGSALQLAIRYGSTKFGFRFHDLQNRGGFDVDVRNGGVMIELDDEDPEVRRQYEGALAAAGLEFRMLQPSES